MAAYHETVFAASKGASATRPGDTGVATLVTFHRFPDLSKELRLQVWEEALPDSRVVEVAWSNDLNRWYCPKGTQSPSGLVRANKESRNVFLKTYVVTARQWWLKFGKFGVSRPNPDLCPVSYIDLKNDVLYVTPPSLIGFYLGPEARAGLTKLVNDTNLGQLRSLACLPPLSPRLFSRWMHQLKAGDDSVGTAQLLHIFSHLTKFIVIVEILHETKIAHKQFLRRRMPPPGEIQFLDIPTDGVLGSYGLEELRKIDLKVLRKSEGPNIPLIVKRCIRKE